MADISKIVLPGDNTVHNIKDASAVRSVKVGSTTVSPAQDNSLELYAGTNITLTPDAANNKVSISAPNYFGTSPISVSGSSITHVDSGVTAASKGDTTDQTPAFGGTFKALSGTVNATGHLTDFAEHTVTIPNAAATTSSAGLMSAADKTKLDTGVADTPITSSEISDIIDSIPSGMPNAEGEDF